MHSKDKGRVVLVGAGCGPGLITQKGLQAIRRAEVLIFDALVDHGLLLEAPEGCEKIDVGKRAGERHTDQEEIQRLLIKKAEEGKFVVRLKGGDSFVFGRGGEECLALKEAGIGCEVIPGVTSAVAVPEASGIPVTHRRIARSFTVVTGHTVEAWGAGEKYETLARLDGTIVFLMAAGHIREIAEGLLAAGKSKMTPVAVISKGCTPLEKRIDGTLETIASYAEGMETPAVIVIGETAGFSLSPTKKQRGRVVLTGTKRFVTKLASRFAEQGILAEALPTLRILPLPAALPEDMAEYDWLVFTSVNGVTLFFEALREARIDLRIFAGKRIACIGQSTAEALSQHGLYAELVPERATSAALGAALAERMGEKERVLLLRAENSSILLPELLRAAKKSCTEVALYRTEMLPANQNEAELKEEDYLVFGSAAGVRAFLAAYPKGLISGVRPVCVGPVAAEELQHYYSGEIRIPEEYSADGIVRCVLSDIGKESGFFLK